MPESDYEPDPSKTRVSVTTDKSLYVFGETITIDVDVKDGLREPLAGADVEVTVDVPSGQTIILTGVTGNDGKATFTVQALQSYGQGQYAIAATASKTDYDTVTATTSCTVLESLVLDVTVWTDKSSYKVYNTVWMYALVKDPLGNPVEGASVHFHVVTASGGTTSSTRTTLSDGQAMWWLVIYPYMGYGTYYVTATANMAGYQQGTDSTTFIVN